MSVLPSMVHRSGDSLIVRSVVSGDQLFGGCSDAAVVVAADIGDHEDQQQQQEEEDAEADDDNDVVVSPVIPATLPTSDLPDCKVKRNYTCSSCDFFTQNPRIYLYHLRDIHHEKVKIYECPSCLYASKHYQKLLRHNKMVHGGANDLLDCKAQQQQQQQQNQLQQRKDDDYSEDDQQDMPEDNRPSVFKCSVCEFTSKNQSALSKHERDEHIKTKFFRCAKCTYVTHIKARYTKHVKYHSMPMIKCDMCDFRTPYKWNLDRHCKNHSGHGTFKCSACNFTADIKQSLTVHEMNHHVPPVGQAVGLGVGRRRNKVGASDTTAAEDAAAAQQSTVGPTNTTELPGTEGPQPLSPVEEDTKKSKTSKPPPPKKQKLDFDSKDHKTSTISDFIHPDDFINHANGKVYIKSKCKLCNYKTAWDTEMAKHERKVHNIHRDDKNKPVIKKPSRPIPNLIPIPSTQSTHLKNNHHQKSVYPVLKTVHIPETSEPMMSQKDINDICAKSSNSVLKDLASLFGSEDVFKTSTPKVPDLIPAAVYNSSQKSGDNKLCDMFKQKNASFFDSLREKLELGTSNNLICSICGHESKCLTEQARHQKMCGKETYKTHSIIPLPNISSSRCQFCRQRCKSSADLYTHLQMCPDALRAHNVKKEEIDSEPEGELKIDEDHVPDELDMSKPHPMENKVFVWNDITVPMDIEVDDSNYEYTDEKIDDNVSLDLSIRTQSPLDSEGSCLGQDLTTTSNNNNNNSIQHSPLPTNEKIPTHGNDISIAQHKRVFKCPHCTFWASTASRFHVHIVGHLNKKPFECSLCSYRSNWRWDITKHIKLKSVRDPEHSSAKVLMTDETGRRNYTKYNKYLTEIPVSSDQSMDTSGGCGTRPKQHQERHASPSTSSSCKSSDNIPKLNRLPNNNEFSPLLMKSSPLRQPPTLLTADGNFMSTMSEKKRSAAEGKKTLFKCKKCNFKDASREVLLEHVKGHYHSSSSTAPLPHSPYSGIDNNGGLGSCSSSGGGGGAGSLVGSILDGLTAQDLRLRGTSPDRDEASVNNISGKGGGNSAPFRCGHCNQVSNWKHVIQRHCRLKHSGDIRVVSNKNGQEKIDMELITDEPDHVDQPQIGVLKCSTCPFSNDDPIEFEHHQIAHTPTDDSVYKCFYCQYFVSQRDELITHLQLHGIANPEEFISRVIDKSPGDGETKKFKCHICPYVTNSKSQYTYHKQFHKPKGGPYTCSYCTYNVSKRHLLHQHLRVHGVNVTSHKQNGEIIMFDDGNDNDEIEEVSSSTSLPLDLQNCPDIPLVWVSKNGKFSKMFKCRYCPHVNLRKVNIQEHEKMHSIREKNPNSSRINDIEHKCSECNYVCNNAGVLSSHSKVHQGLYGNVHCLVDPTKTDEEQIRELSKSLGLQIMPENMCLEETDILDSPPNETDEIDSSSGSGSVLYFCKDCPARFLKENEFGIHKRFHGLRLYYKCENCSYTSREKPHICSHAKVHTSEYQDRTKVLQGMYMTSLNYQQPKLISRNINDEIIWIVEDSSNKPKEMMSTLCSILNKPLKSSQNVPLSGTDLFLQREEAQQKHAAEMIKEISPPPPQPTDAQVEELMHGNPKFVYQTYLKNGRMKEKRYKCHKCPSAFDKREQYKVHLGLHGSKQRYECQYCDYSVKYYANYVQHLKKHKLDADAHRATTRRSSDEMELEIDESAEVTSPDEENSDEKPLKLIAAPALAEDAENEVTDDKKLFECQNCPYTSPRKDAVDNHQKRHVSVSGIKSTYTCDHCDYSVLQNHIMKEHTKLHFMPNRTTRAVEGYMICDNIKLTSNKIDDDESDNNKKVIIFEENGSKLDDDKVVFNPPLSSEVAERFNNNEGEKQFVNVQTGELEVVKKNISDTTQSSEDKDYCEMEVN